VGAAGNIVIFQHIAKTGGTSLGKAIGSHFPVEHQLGVNPGAAVSALGTWSIDSVREAWEALAIGHRASIRYVGGHLRFGVHSVFDRPARYVTVLRDPVERVISGFFYSIGRHVRQTGEHVTLGEYVFRRRHYDLGLNNYQTRVITGLPDLDPVGDYTTGNTRPVSDEDLRVAIKNIDEHFDLVGTTENLDMFLSQFAAQTGAASAMALSRENVTAGRPVIDDIPANIVAEIKRQNLYDIALYEHICRKTQ
jgi:hypothetical protein